jgi:hypothetical protein
MKHFNYGIKAELLTNGNKFFTAEGSSMAFRCGRSGLNTEKSGRLLLFGLSQRIENLLAACYAGDSEVKILIYSGYKGSEGLIFKGTVYFMRQLAHNGGRCTELLCCDGYKALYQTYISCTINKGLSLNNLFTTLAAETALPVARSVRRETTLQRAQSIEGRPIPLLQTYSGADVFIENEMLWFLDKEEILQSDFTLLNRSGGLYAVYRVNSHMIKAVMRIEHRLKTGQYLMLQSSCEGLNGSYKVMAFRHQLIKEPSGAEQLTTNILLREFQNIRK